MKAWKKLKGWQKAAIIGTTLATLPSLWFAVFLTTHIPSENLTNKEEANRLVLIFIVSLTILALGALLGAAIQDWRQQRHKPAKTENT